MDTFIIKEYLQFQLRAKTRYGTHSPFIYSLLEDCFYDKRNFYAFKLIEKQRNKFLGSKQSIKITDLGAGSRTNKSNTRAVAKLAAHVATSQKDGQLLFKLINHLRPQTMLELGTSLGIGTLYQALPNKQSIFHSIEGDPAVLKLALESLEAGEAQSVQTHLGNFDDVLPKLLNSLDSVEYAYIDGNHTYEATINYFNMLIPKTNANSFFVFDDIRWSKGMLRAWETICQHPQVSISIDLFNKGIVFFKEGRVKEHFSIKY